MHAQNKIEFSCGHYRLATSEKPGERGRQNFSQCLKLQPGRIFQFFEEQFLAVDDVRHTVSDGLYSKYTPHLSVLYKYLKKRKEKKKGP